MKRAAIAALLSVFAAGCGIIRDPAAPDDGSVRSSSITNGSVGTATVTITIILPKEGN